MVFFTKPCTFEVTTKKLLIILLIILFLSSCDLSEPFGLKPEPKGTGTNFASIFATARPVYLKIVSEGWNKKEWETFKNSELNWYVFPTDFANVDPVFSSILRIRDDFAEGNLKDNINDIEDAAIVLRDNSSTHSFPDGNVVNLAFVRSIERLDRLVESTILTSEYILGDSIDVSINTLEHQNHHIGSSETDISDLNKDNHRFKIVIETGNEGGTTYTLVTKETFPYHYTHMDTYIPLNFLEYKAITFTLEEGARIKVFKVNENIIRRPQNYINRNRLTIEFNVRTQKEYKQAQNGRIFDITIESGNGEKEESHHFNFL